MFLNSKPKGKFHLTCHTFWHTFWHTLWALALPLFLFGCEPKPKKSHGEGGVQETQKPPLEFRNAWEKATSLTQAPQAREAHTAVWTGEKMIVWGGFGGSDYRNDGRLNTGALLH